MPSQFFWWAPLASNEGGQKRYITCMVCDWLWEHPRGSLFATIGPANESNKFLQKSPTFNFLILNLAILN